MAFPTNATLLDDFNRANVGPPPSASWTSQIFLSDNNALRVLSNQCGSSGTGSNQTAWWNPTTFGPDVEVYAQVPAFGLSGHYAGLFARLTGTGTVASSGYVFYAVGDSQAEFYRVVDGTYTAIGAAISQAWLPGDWMGFEVVGTTLTGYRKTGGAWSVVGTRTDSTYTGAGHIGLYTDNNTIRFDDFSGGPVVTASPGGGARRMMMMGVG